jgi:AcrR family transcriptional regulator
MQRARSAVLEATAHCVERYGVRRTTMGDIALKAVVAKATLYNHFRTKDDVLAALVRDRVAALGREAEAVAGREGLAAALRLAGRTVATSPPLRRLVADDPAMATRLLAPGGGPGWDEARSAVRLVLTAGTTQDEASGAADDAVDVVLRWVLSQVFWPAGPADGDAQADLLAAALVSSRPSPPTPDA